MGRPVGLLRNHAVGTSGEPQHIQMGHHPRPASPAPRPRPPEPGAPFITAATLAARGSPASRRTQSTPPPAPGTASGRNKKGNPVNSFRIQHFPHSIIFKLNNLSLREKGKRPLSSALPAAQSRHCGADGERVSVEPTPQCPLSYARSRQRLRLPRSAETLAHGHTASVGLLSAPGGLGGDTGKPGQAAKKG